jgi:ribonuclease Z
MRTQHDGPVVISQDLTTFDITASAIVVRQRILDPMAWAVIGETKVSGPPMSAPHTPPAWWADALLTL